MSTDADSSAVACSSTLWAQASKEWVIPAKPKPGRKPKKDSSQPAKEDTDQDAKGRRVQNRAAQRAFRERKQSQLQELQERVQAYEKSEIQRNVALQQASKRLLEENGQLKGEIATLKDEVARLQQRLTEATQASTSETQAQNKRLPQPETSKRLKRWRHESSTTDMSGVEDTTVFLEDPSARKRPRAEADNSRISLTPAPKYRQGVAYSTSPPSMVSSPDSNGLSTTPFSPLTFSGTTTHSSYGSAEPISSTTVDAFKTFSSMEGSPFEGLDCGLCSEGGVCMCTELALSSAAAMVSGADGHIISLSSFGGAQDQVLKVEEIESSLRILQDVTVPPVQPSAPYQIRLPSPEPTPTPSQPKRSMPLRSRVAKRSAASGKVWQLTQAANAVPPTCSGDPTNCPACKDDDFGRAFCQALVSASRTRGTACASCPNPEACGKAPRSTTCSNGTACAAGATGSQIIDLTGAEQDQAQRTSATTTPPPPSNTSSTENPSSTSSTPVPASGDSAKSGTIPVNEAWARLKSHPNIAFADLSMLADVVARRVKCSGPVAVIHPAPGACTPERDAARSPAVPDIPHSARKDSGPVLLTDPHALYHAQAGKRTQYSNTSAPANMASAGNASVAAVHDTLPQDPPTSQSLVSSLPVQSFVAPVASHPVGLRLSDKPSLVPQEQLRECGRRRIREVDTAGVNDALRILDAQFGKHV